MKGAPHTARGYSGAGSLGYRSKAGLRFLRDPRPGTYAASFNGCAIGTAWKRPGGWWGWSSPFGGGNQWCKTRREAGEALVTAYQRAHGDES